MQSKGKDWGGSYGGFGWQLALGRLAGTKSHVDARRVIQRCASGKEIDSDWSVDLRARTFQLDPKAIYTDTRNPRNLIAGNKVVPGVLYPLGELTMERWPVQDDRPRDLVYRLVGYAIGGVDKIEHCSFLADRPFYLERSKLRSGSEFLALLESVDE